MVGREANIIPERGICPPTRCGFERPTTLSKGVNQNINEDVNMTIPALATHATNPNVFIHNGIAVTSSRSVGDYFRKMHKDVIRKIESLDCSPEFTGRNFTLSEYTDSTGRKLPMYEMTKDGFVFLVMGFTGKKAAAFKEAYIAEFNRMESELYRDMTTATQPSMVTITLTEEELCSLCWLWKIADDFRQDAAEVYPALRQLGSNYGGSFYDMAKERRATLSVSHQALIRVTSCIEPTATMINRWKRILPQIRQAK